MSTSAPPSAGSAPAATAAPVVTESAADKSAKPIKPIKGPLKFLPGMSDPTEGDEQIAEARKARAAKAEAARSEQTKHLDAAITDSPAPSKSPGDASKAQGSGDPAEVDTAPSEAPAVADPAKQASDAASPEAVERLKYLNQLTGGKFDTIDAAEHSLKTLRGMHKSLVSRAEEAERKAEGWYKEAQRLMSAPPTPQSQESLPTHAGKQDSAAAIASKSPVDLLLEAVNPKMFEQIRERSGDTTAILWALSKQQEAMETRIQALLDSRVAPFENQSKETAEAQRIVETFRQVANLTNDSGDPLYPEFEDPTFANAAYHVWKEMDMSEKVAYSHKGVHAAYLAAKDYFTRSGIQLANSNKTIAPAKPTAATAEAVDKVAEAVAAGLNGRRADATVSGNSVPANRPAANESAADAIRRRILAAETSRGLPGLVR